MKKILKWVGVLLGVSAAVSVALSLFVSSKKKACLQGEGWPAMEACSFLVNWQTGTDKAEYLFRRAQLRAKGQMWDGELADLEAAAAAGLDAGLAKERLALIYGGLVKAYGLKGDAPAVVRSAGLAVQAGIADPEIHIALAGAYIEEKKFTEAVELLDRAGGLPNARKHPYYNTLAAAYGGLGEYEKAYDALKTALTVPAPRPVLASTSKNMGLACFELKRYSEAETYLSYALRAGAECPECGLLLTTIRGALEPAPRPSRAKKQRK